MILLFQERLFLRVTWENVFKLNVTNYEGTDKKW